MEKYSISRWEGCWLWCGDGNNNDGCTASLPNEVLEAADDGFRGELEVEGESYRIDGLN